MRVARREELPRFLPPMLARSGTSAGGDGWALEVKWDGARMQAAFDGRSLCLRSRPGRSCTDEFPKIEPDGISARRLILDGELVCFGSDGLPDFAALRNRLGQRPRFHGRPRPVLATFVAFDILHLDGHAVRDLPYLRRRELLAELALDTPRWRTPPHAVSGERAGSPEDADPFAEPGRLGRKAPRRFLRRGTTQRELGEVQTAAAPGTRSHRMARAS